VNTWLVFVGKIGGQDHARKQKEWPVNIQSSVNGGIWQHYEMIENVQSSWRKITAHRPISGGGSQKTYEVGWW